MATPAVSRDIEEYLNTSYSPDREYIDGELVERNVGKWSTRVCSGCLQAFSCSRNVPGVCWDAWSSAHA